MRAIVLIAVSLFALVAAAERRDEGPLILDGIPEIPRRVAERSEQYWAVRSAKLFDWDASGNGMLVGTNFGETVQVHRVAVPGGNRRQLTFFSEPVADAFTIPNGFLFRMDRGGSERFQLYRYELETGRHTRISSGKGRVVSLIPSKEGGKVAYASTERNGRDFDLYVLGLGDAGGPRRLKELKGIWVPVDWSSGNRRLLAVHFVSALESTLWVFDPDTGESKQVNPDGPKQAYNAAVFARQGDAIFYSSDEGGEVQRLFRYDFASGKKELVTPKLSWDVSAVEVSRDGARIAFSVNEGGRSTLYLGTTADPAKAERVDMPLGVISGLRFDPAAARLGFTLSAPGGQDVYALDVADRKLVRWTESEVGGLNPATFIAPELIEFESFDGRKIPAWYYRPAAGRQKKPWPVIVDIHGGPEAQAKASFKSLVQYFVNELGVAVLQPNVRGSAGYGKSYLSLDDGPRREDSVKDIGKLLDWIAGREELDAKRVGVSGGSYGGYMVLASLAHFGDRLRCGVDMVGIANFVTFLKNTQSYRRNARRAEYGDERDPKMRELLLAISPTTQSARIRKPLFVAQGLNDPRVPVSEAEQIVNAVRQNGGTVWYLLAKDEGHGFRKKRRRAVYINAMTLFFEQFLLR